MLRVLWLAFCTLLMTIALAGPAQASKFTGNGKPPATCTLSGTTYTCSTIFSGDNDTAEIASGYTVLVTADLVMGYFQDIKMTGTARLETTGSYKIDITNTQQNNFSTDGATIKAGGNFSLGNGKTITANIIGATVDIVGSSSKITGTITATGNVNLVSGTQVTGAVSGGNITVGADAKLGSSLIATGAIRLESRVTVASGLSGASISTDSDVKITGAVKIAGLADFASGNTVTGKVDAGSLTLRSANATINGNVTVTGDTLLENSTVINGDLDANNVKTGDSNARINGNATVNSIYFGYGGTVSKVITCKNPPNPQKCSCVTYSSTYSYSPTCAAAAPASAHHFQITHSGNALTCQPQTVTVTACSNADCSTLYNNSIKTTLQPGGAEFTITGGSNSAASVSRSTAGTATLSASGAPNPTTCVGASGTASTSCDMVFSDTGLALTVPDHVSMTAANVTLQALKSAPAPNAGKTCVPLVASTTATVNFSCSQIDPANAAKPGMALKNSDAANYTSVSCGSGSTGVPLKFNADGLATANLQYSEVGKVSLSASYTSGNLGASTPAGGTAFTVAPKAFRLKATRVGTTPALPTGVFARAGEQFTLQISAVNALPDNPSNMDANVTKNFGKESTRESVQQTISVTEPTGGVGKLAGSFVITDGTASGPYTFDEVGKITITATNINPSTSTSTTNGTKPPTYYMGISRPDFETRGTLDLGRFIPDHFDTTLPQPLTDTAAGDTMDCSKTGGIVQPCSKRLVYSRQPFQLVVSAYNSAGALTKNYSGAYARTITLLSWSNSVDTATVKAVEIDGMGWSEETSGGPKTRFTFAGGVGTLVKDSQNPLNLPYFAFAAASTPSNPTRFVVRATDTDGVTSARSAPAELELTAISGQLYIAPNFGSVNAPMPMHMEARFYLNGGYRLNPAFALPAPSLDLNSLRYSNCQKLLAADANGNCTAAAQLKLSGTGQPTFSNGKSVFRLQGPGIGPGSVGISLRGQCPTGASCPDWITYLPATVGNATFGIYRSGPVIYTREVY